MNVHTSGVHECSVEAEKKWRKIRGSGVAKPSLVRQGSAFSSAELKPGRDIGASIASLTSTNINTLIVDFRLDVH